MNPYLAYGVEFFPLIGFAPLIHGHAHVFLKVMEAFANAEKTKKPNWKEMFTDVYDDVPDHLV